MSTVVKGNPNTHTEESRTSHRNWNIYYKAIQRCAWCGQSPRTLFSYNGSPELFCNKDCFRSYHG